MPSPFNTLCVTLICGVFSVSPTSVCDLSKTGTMLSPSASVPSVNSHALDVSGLPSYSSVTSSTVISIARAVNAILLFTAFSAYELVTSSPFSSVMTTESAATLTVVEVCEISAYSNRPILMLSP